MHIKTTISNHLKRATLTLLTLILTCATAWADTENVSYIDANGNTQTVTATVLTGNEGYLGTEGQTKWYVANSNISYSGGFSCSGNVNIILGDSKTMVVNGSINENGNLTIYGQSGQSGILNATNSSGYYAICCNPGNFIINGGNAANQWRTLTHDEWAYLFNTRDGAASKYGHGSVDGVNGMIILPDNWTLPDGCSFTPGNSDWTNSYTTTEWAAMEAAGAVFLPAEGQRSFGTFVNNVGNLGRYWSSTHRNNTAAYDVWFHSDFISELDTQVYYSNRSMGYSVRPVQDAQ